MRVTITALACAALLGVTGAKAQIPTVYTNLQVLPKQIPRQDLVPIMRNFALNLGVRCQHCHVGEGDDLSTFDFASDARPAKAVARKMLRMVTTINDQLLMGVGTPAPAGAPKVTCFTCHRGATKPLTAPASGGRPTSVAITRTPAA